MSPAFTLRTLLIVVGVVATSCAVLVQWPMAFFLTTVPLAFGGVAYWATWFVSTRPRPGYLSVIAFAFIGVFVLALMLPAVQSPREPRRNVCRNTLHQLGLALATYHANHGCYPPAYLADAQGHPLVSWRVLLLPYLENRQLFDEWKKHRDEPWNGPHNIKLSQMVLDVFRCPSDTGPATDTSYVAVVGPGTIWPGTAQVSNSQITDGTSNTILLVEVANSGINWMEPRELDFTNRAPGVNSRSGLGVSSEHPGAANVHFADGRTTWIPEHISNQDLQTLFTIAGGEIVRLP